MTIILGEPYFRSAQAIIVQKMATYMRRPAPLSATQKALSKKVEIGLSETLAILVEEWFVRMLIKCCGAVL